MCRIQAKTVSVAVFACDRRLRWHTLCAATVNEGEIFGFIGPNGAGKSTTIRTLLSLIHKTSGEAKIFGLDCEKDRKKILADVGYLPSEIFYYENMKAIDLFRYSASFYKKDCTARINELSSVLELDLNKKIENMSLGNKKKVGIIQGLLHSPRLLVMDEPTIGLDPLMQRTFFDLIKQEQKRGAAVLFSSHILSEVQRICDRVAIIKEGRIIDTQKVGDLQQNTYKKVSFTAIKTDNLSASDNLSMSVDLSVSDNLSDFILEGATNVSVKGDSINFIYKGDCNTLLTKIGMYRLSNIDITEPSLEEIFMHYYTN